LVDFATIVTRAEVQQSHMQNESAPTPSNVQDVGSEPTLRQWHPVALTDALTEEKPVKLVRILDRKVVLFRTSEGEIGLIQERCPHSGYPLEWGDVWENSLVCPRHGWQFGPAGNCFIVGYQGKIYPMEWAQATAYPVATYGAMYWACIGALPDETAPTELLAAEIECVLRDCNPLDVV
jgi:phenylpropionate dioxygenase-like ring-hydroxylating dioxygenase large terminal subunit